MFQLPAVLLTCLLFGSFARAQDTLSCRDSSLTWYTYNEMNPCQQYRLLRQQCESGYTVPQMERTRSNSSNPPERCSGNTQCCCNSVAFNMAMLCLNCQQGGNMDAGDGTYLEYLNQCNPSMNLQLPNVVQENVCASGLDVRRYLYEIQDTNGRWSFEAMQKLAERGNNEPSGKCQTTAASSGDALVSTTSSGSSSSPTASASAPPASQTAARNEELQVKKTGISVGTVVGAVTGTAAFCGVGLLSLWFFYLRRPRSIRKRDPKGDGQGDFDILPSHHSKSNSTAELAHVYVNNPYVTGTTRERPVTQTFSELTMPVPLTIPSEFNYQSSFSGTPFSTQFPNAPGGWRSHATPPSNGRTSPSRGSRSAPSTASGPSARPSARPPVRDRKEKR